MVRSACNPCPQCVKLHFFDQLLTNEGKSIICRVYFCGGIVV